MKRLCLGLLLLTGCKQVTGDASRQVLATVNGAPITTDDLRRRFERSQMDDEDGQPLGVVNEAQKRALLDDMIVRRLVLQEAEKLNILVGIDEVEAAFQRLRAGWKDDEFEQMLKTKDATTAELKAELREHLMIKKYFRDHVFARVAVTDADIAKYIETHPEVQVHPEDVHALQIVVKTEEKAKMIAQEIRRGLAFEDAAMKYSLSPEGKSGGDLGFFARGSMPQIFDEVCFSTPVGQISKVVASDFGYHIFKVVERRDIRVRPFDEVRDQVESILRRDAERAAQDKKTEELKHKAEIVVHDKELARIQ